MDCLSKVQQTFSTVLFTNQTSLKIDDFLLSGSQEGSICPGIMYTLGNKGIAESISSYKHSIILGFTVYFTLKIVPVNSAFFWVYHFSPLPSHPYPSFMVCFPPEFVLLYKKNLLFSGKCPVHDVHGSPSHLYLDTLGKLIYSINDLIWVKANN